MRCMVLFLRATPSLVAHEWRCSALHAVLLSTYVQDHPVGAQMHSSWR